MRRRRLDLRVQDLLGWRWVTTSLFVQITSVVVASHVTAQTVTPNEIRIDPTSPVCAEGTDSQTACIRLPDVAVNDQVDVCFLFDDTGSFAGFVPTVRSIFSGLVGDLEAALPGVSFGFCVARFEDYGGPGRGFSSESARGRPFTLNQPVITAEDAGGPEARDALIVEALARSAPGGGGDGPEAAIGEGLFQLATGLGFDGDGDGATLGLDGTQRAGATSTQVLTDASGDVPAFASLDPVVPVSGTIGGAGFRAAALKLVILATDICPIATFDAALGVPDAIDTPAGPEPTSELRCSDVLGRLRFGFRSDAKTTAENTIDDAVAPAGAATVPETIAALNRAGIRVLGLAPSGRPLPVGSGPAIEPSAFLSSLARATGALDTMGQPLVFAIAGGGEPLRDAIVGAITEAVTRAIDISLVPDGVIPPGLALEVSPDVVREVSPGEQACFGVGFSGTGSPFGSFELRFLDVGSGGELGRIPTSVACMSAPRELCDVNGDGVIDRTDIGSIFASRNQPASGPGDPRDADADGFVTVNDGRACVLRCTRSGCAP